MKKLGLLILLLVLPFSVNAASINVKTLDTSVEGSTIKYNGEMEDGSVAVMCKLYNGEDEIDYLSSSVDSNKFDGSFIVSATGTYKVYCANYEGGEYKIAEASVTDIPKSTNAKTGDTIVIYVVILGVAVTGLIGAILLLGKKKQNN